MLQTEKIANGASTSKVLWTGLLIGFLLNLTGWLGNNLLLDDLWDEVGNQFPSPWRKNIWSDIFSLIPDFVYGIAISWLCNYINVHTSPSPKNWLKVGIFISVVGGITTYFAIANSGFIPWKLAIASFILVISTKIPLAILAGKLLTK